MKKIAKLLILPLLLGTLTGCGNKWTETEKDS
jgi:predicted small lipoprotein YifL